MKHERAATSSDEVPVSAPAVATPWAASRRDALKLLSAALAATASGCSRPPEKIEPYVDMPERMVPGVPLYFATALSFAGYAQPAIVETHEGRPTKIEGNPGHDASRGATDAFTQAQIFSLYDPGRARVIQERGSISNWDALLNALTHETARWRASQGQGLALLTGRVTSPSLGALIQQWMQTFPRSQWHVWEPVSDANARAGADLAFGRPLDALWRLDHARAIVSLDHDFLGPGPDQVRLSHEFSRGRRARRGVSRLTRLHVAEASLTTTGANADERLASPRRGVSDLATALAAALGAPLAVPALPDRARAFVARAARELTAATGGGLVTVGHAQPAEVHALVHWMNGKIGAIGKGVEFIAAVDAIAGLAPKPLDELSKNLHAGTVDSLIMLDVNPVYDAPAELDFAGALRKARFTAALGLEFDETGKASHWQIPSLHALESWGDLKAATGEVTLVQPMIAPLHAGRSATALLHAAMGLPARSDYEVLRDFWRTNSGAADFETWWRGALHDGLVPGGAAKPASVGAPQIPQSPAPSPMPQAPQSDRFEITFDPDPSVYDGRFAQNAWLQELPRPLTRQVWGNAAEISSADAARHAIVNGDHVRLTIGKEAIEIAAYVSAGQAPGSISLRLGGGRTTGAIGGGVGVNVAALRTMRDLWARNGVALTKTDRKDDLLLVQASDRTHGEEIVRTMSLADLAAGKAFARKSQATLYPQTPIPGDGLAWGMAIDQTVCTGCNSCVAACQAENNIPVVGPEEVARGRDMHWLRIDTYLREQDGEQDVTFQPVPCMQCEKAPCEPVCPVEASVHDSEGLNVQVYNRCIGTRFCEANCPYKVRRFNFFSYGDGQEYKTLGAPLLQAAHNPDVSVRARGVMEKCTYCVQRISYGRREAEKDRRAIRDGEVRTACQQACPTDAIHFGNLLDTKSDVLRLKQEPHNYALLEELGTRPRTTYLAKVRDKGAEGSGGQ